MHLPDPSLLEQPYQYDGRVLIIGAGASGLAAARILEKNKIDFSILEATDRLGGRLKEDTTFANFPLDLGAEWIHNLPGVVLDVLSGQPGKCEEIDLVRQWIRDLRRWDGRNLTKLPSYYKLFHRFFPEYKFKRSTWYDFVTKHVAGKNVQDRIQFEAPVTEIDYKGSKVVVTTADGQKHEADKVIMTASVGVLRSGNIAFVPDLPEEKKKALDKIDFHKGFKMALKFSKKFYPDVINHRVTSGEKNFYDMAFGKADTADHVLGALVTGSGAEPYYSLASEGDIVKAVLAELDAMFDGEATRCYTGDYRFEDWGHSEFTQGTWVEGIRISKATVASLAQPLGDGKIYFAGEALDTFQQMGVPGAILSGYKAVSDMMMSHQ